MRFIPFVVCACVATSVLTVTRASAQPEVPSAASTLAGGWTLNHELSSTVPSPDGGDGNRPAPPAGGPGAGRGGGGGRGGPGGGFGGGGASGPPGGGFGGRGGSGGPDPRKMEETMQTMRELMTPTAHWVIGEAEGGTLVFSSAEGRSVRYVTDNKKEKHQVAGGTIETKTKWDNGQLRQEIDVATGMKAVRVFTVTPGEISRLIVTTTLEGEAAGRGGRRPPVRFVYDRDEQ